MTDSDGDPTRITVTLSQRGAAAMARITAATGDSTTEAVNRALTAYDHLLELQERCEGKVTVQLPGGDLERMYFL